MISSKKITLISILLTAAAFMFTVAVMLYCGAGPIYGEDTTFAAEDMYTEYADSPYETIELTGDTAVSDSSGVLIDGGSITILGGGVYVISGTLDNGSITVNAEDGAEVRLVLNGASITSSDYSAIYVKEAAKTVISIEDGTENYISDGSEYDTTRLDDGKPSATLYSKDDLTINGGGKLTVCGNYLNGIKVNDTLKITGGELCITAVNDGINVNDLLAVKGGIFTIAVGDDAVHSDMNVMLEPESMDITSSYEGIEGAYVTINGGEIRIVSSDDGINATGAETEEMPGGPGRADGSAKPKTDGEDIFLNINGGNIYIKASGDGIDSNGSALMSGGNVQVYGPGNSGNSSIDVGDGGYVFIMNGGTLTAAGSSGMAEYPYNGSQQRSVVFFLSEEYEAGSTLTVKDSAGNELGTWTSGSRFSFVCLSTADIAENETYTLYINGSETATVESAETVSVYGNAAGAGGMGGRGGMRGGMNETDGVAMAQDNTVGAQSAPAERRQSER